MRATCENCRVAFEVTSARQNTLACPSCGHVSAVRSPSPQAAAPRPPEDLLDQSKTMIGPMDGRMGDETSAVQRATAGKKPGLQAGREPVLVVLDGDEKGKRIVIHKNQFTLGRKEADLILTDPEASRRHCQILIYGDVAVVRDLGSANGTMVNEKIVKEGVLKPGDKLQIGATIFQFGWG